METTTVILSALFLLAAALGVAYMTQARQGRIDRNQDLRMLRDGKRERLREAYKEILTTALSLEKLAGVYAWLGGR
ncbi:MAG TPA: hypothetical protein VHH54_00715, partial [Actinomycetota bacterium]|nr:hypothetical protein [Actinomycetota bacterium]